MYKLIVLIVAATAASVSAAPGFLSAPLAAAPVAYTAPAAYAAAPYAYAAAAPVVTAHSSQVVAQRFNGLAAAPLVAPASYVASAPLLAPAPFVGTAPYVDASAVYFK